MVGMKKANVKLKARMGRAIKAAQKEANNLEKRASAMKAAASTKTKKK